MRLIYSFNILSIAELTRIDVSDSVYGVCGVIMDVSVNQFDHEIHFRISQGEDEILYFSTVISE